MSYESSVQQLEATNAQLVKEVVRSRDLVAAMGNLYPSISEGRAAVANGQYFAVPGGANVYATLYRKTGATTQDTIAEYPSRDALATAAFANVATLQQALDGAAGVLPDAEQVHEVIRDLAVGTVSQAGGVPTGSIIERGSNVNGEYIKFADGTMICTIRAAIGGAWSTGVELSRTWTFPAGFSALPSFVFFGYSGGVAGGGIAQIEESLTTTGVVFQIKNNTTGDIGAGNKEKRTAIGRWY